VSGNYGPGDGGPWPPAANEPQRDDSVWQQDQPSPWGGQDGAQPGYGQQQPYDGRGYGGQDYAQGQGYDQAQGYDQGQTYPGQGYGGQAYEQPGYDARNYGQPDPRTRSGYPPQGPGTGPQQYPRTGPQPLPRGAGGQQVERGTGGQRVQRGTGGMQQVPPGYDPRGTGPRGPVGGDRDYPSGGYPQRGAAGYGQGGYEGRDPGQRDDSFLPGFGPRDDFDGGDQQYDGRRDPRRGAARRARDGRADGRAADIGRGPDGRAVDFAGQDQRVRGGRGRARDDDRDPRGPSGPRRGSARDDWDGNGGNGGPGGYGGDGPRRRRRSPIRRLAPWIALLVIVVPLAIGGLHIWGIYQAKVHPADYTGAGIAPTVTIQVPSGATPDSLAPTLLQDGVIASTRAFTNIAGAAATGVQLEPGYFMLKTHMQASLAWAYLTNPKNMLQTVVTIPEGKRASQVIAIVAQKTKIPLKDFQTVLDHPSKLGLPSYADGKVEGYLFPATYAIVPHETALQILQAMVTRFNQEASSVQLQAAAQRLGISATDVIIEASMAQAEGGSVSDYPKIAEVINNRLKIHMALQFDSVLLYGLNKYAINVSDAQIATPGPYNDFEHTGLPPGPISNPGDAAIQGILHPDTGNWIYFLTVTGGKSEFSPTPLPGQ
jgi:uncharacterized YceG family protein